METAIKVGNEITKQSSDNLQGLIESIFKTGAETRMDQATIVRALEVIGQVVEVKEISIRGCTITGDRHIHVDEP